MGIFRRTRDIVNSNINAMLDKAEDPEKLIRLMLGEMEEVLVRIKRACAEAMATEKGIGRDIALIEKRRDEWQHRAQLAVDKGRDDLARSALLEQRRCREDLERLEEERRICGDTVSQYREEICAVEAKVALVRERQRLLIARHTHARYRKAAEHQIRRLDTSNAMIRFDEFVHRVDRMDAEGELINFGRSRTAEEQFTAWERDEEIEMELQALKTNRSVQV